MDFELLVPKDLEEALYLKNKYGNDAWILSGGTDLVVNIKSNAISPRYVISTKKINKSGELISFDGSSMYIKASATLSDVEKNASVLKFFPELAKAVSTIGSKQIRNSATLIGNVCNASPAGDSLPALFVNDAELVLISQGGRRMVKLMDFLLGPRKTTIASNEIAHEIIIRKNSKPYLYSDYYKLTRTKGVDISGLGICIKMLDEYDVRIAMGAVAPTPIRCYDVEELIKQKGLMNLDLNELADMAANNSNPITDLRASKEYRVAMIKNHVHNLLMKCKKAL